MRQAKDKTTFLILGETSSRLREANNNKIETSILKIQTNKHINHIDIVKHNKPTQYV